MPRRKRHIFNRLRHSDTAMGDQLGCMLNDMRSMGSPVSPLAPPRQSLQNAKIKLVKVWLQRAYTISGSDWSEIESLMRIRHAKRPARREITPESFCLLSRAIKSRKHRTTTAPHQATDQPIEPMPGELEAVRTMLAEIEKMLAGLFGPAYDRAAVAMAGRAKAAELAEAYFDDVVEKWARAVEQSFEESLTLDRLGMANALVRFLAHLRDPDDLQTFVHLRRHCHEGMLARAKPSQFNIFHIALKQVILNLVRAKLRGRQMEIVRDVPSIFDFAFEDFRLTGYEPMPHIKAPVAV